MRASDYPFAHEAAELVRQSGYTLESLAEKTSFRPVRQRALERVMGAISGQIPDVRAETEAEILTELLSYPLARVMISCLKDDLLMKRYALTEAKLAYARMQREKDIIPLAQDLGFHPQQGEPIRLHFLEYLRAAHRMHTPRWKLVNRDLRGGYLTVSREELMRLLEEMVRDRVQKGLPLEVGAICDKFRDQLTPLKEDLEASRLAQRVDLGRVEEGAFPPCMRKMISEVSQGLNLAHTARFALTSFLLQVNMTPAEVVALFQRSPDFDPERTRYQVEHIAGASGTRYKPPTCATMMTYGNCPGEDQLCRRIRHPLSYYEARMRRLREAGSKEKDAPPRAGQATPLDLSEGYPLVSGRGESRSQAP
jgi:DNA primase large subunit